MMTAKQVVPTPDVGILVGRWQIHKLHEAHEELITTVLNKHDHVIIFVGLSPLRNTTVNPLDYATRKKMINERFPTVEVCYIDDHPSDKAWSDNLDREIGRWIKPHQTCMLYGSRDSFIQYYVGQFPTTELESTKHISGTEIRRRISNTYPNSAEFRAGAIAASLNRYPTCYPTIDVAILSSDRTKVLMGRKHTDAHVRFIGGFASPGSVSYEVDVRREVGEETGVEVDNIIYIGSTIIDDWRYRNEVDKIKTLMFVADHIFGKPVAGDDIASVEWVPLVDLISHRISVEPAHEPLVSLLAKYIGSLTRASS